MPVRYTWKIMYIHFLEKLQQKEKKKAEAKPKPVQKEKPANDGQLSLLDLGMTKAG
mgnify:CR=1 FL=1